jgi:hypothetical protein
LQSARTRTRPISAWGFAPELIVTQACGLLLLAAVNTAGRFAYPWALDLFYVGLIVIYAPTFFRMLLPTVSRRERVALVVATGLSLYMVKVLHSPASFTLHDELLHWKTVDSIRQSGYLFKENPLLPVSPLYPGLHLLTVALSEMLGIGTFGAGVLLLGMIRIVLAVALFSLLEYTTDSPQIAGLGTLIYMCNSNFVFFLSQYAYESVALPLGLLLLVLLFRRHTLSALPRLVVNVCVLALLFSIVATHHVTTYMMLAFLAGSVFVYTTWARIEPLIRRIADWVETWWIYRRVARTFIPYSPEDAAIFGKVQPQHMFFWTALLLAIASLAWMLYVATPTLGYLTPVFSEAFRELVNIIRQENASRQLFASEGGNIRPLWERLTAVGAVLLSVIAFPYGVIEVWRRYRNRTGTILLAFAAGMYFVTLSFRFTEKGWELSNRSSEFLFVGLGFIIALAIVARLRYHDYQAIWIWVFAVGGTILLIGGLLAGWAYWARIPGPYMVGADTRSIEEQGLIAAGWIYRQTRALWRIVLTAC